MQTYHEESIQELVHKFRQIIVLGWGVQTDEVGKNSLASLRSQSVLQPMSVPLLVLVVGRVGNISIDCFNRSFRRGLEVQDLTVSNEEVVRKTLANLNSLANERCCRTVFFDFKFNVTVKVGIVRYL